MSISENDNIMFTLISSYYIKIIFDRNLSHKMLNIVTDQDFLHTGVIRETFLANKCFTFNFNYFKKHLIQNKRQMLSMH